MSNDSMTPLQRVMLIVAASILLPSVILLGWLFRENSMKDMEALEANGKQAADLVVLLADTRAEADLTALRVLSTAKYFVDGDFIGAAKRSGDVLSLIPGWKAVTLADVANGNVHFTVTPSGVTMGGARPPVNAKTVPKNGFGGVDREGDWCPCLRLQVGVRDRSDLVLSAIVDPTIYQNLLMKDLQKDTVVALVDQNGNFIARSLDFDGRVGKPATEFVREAIARGGRGTYRGTTLEGLQNYSAYTVSDTTGWSSHVAINHTLFDGPRGLANSAIVIGALAAILIGAVLYIYVARDIAARRLEDRRLMEFQKAEAVKEFTATIIHDFRNIAAAVQSGLNTISRYTKEQKTKDYAVMIGEVMDRGTRLTNRLLSFVRKDNEEICSIEINTFLAGMDYLLQQAAGPGVRVIMSVPNSEVRLAANRDQLELALVNLVVNARDAMSGSGKIEISVLVDERHVRICVADTGPGIPPDMKQQVFARFFTTKVHGSGTGLGLSQVAEMVREANGQVSIEEAKSGGALFVLQFNRSSNELALAENAMVA